jgi:TatA/E family protein of Tat protein translocase
MEIFGMGPLEILVILIVALMVFGPGKLPQIARNLGRAVAALRKATKDLTEEMSREFQELEREGKDLADEEKAAARKSGKDGEQ